MARQLSLDETAAPLVPERPSLPKLREAAAGCTACHLYQDATQTVFGEGARSAEVMFVGEQPGDHEDRAGKPFVGPAGRLFDDALEDAGIDRTQVYVTNAVKHFKWRARGKRRIHQKPNWSEFAACRPWLDAELAVVTQQRGRPVESDLAEHVLATVHPSSILRGDPETRERDYAQLVKDLKVVADLL